MAFLYGGVGTTGGKFILVFCNDFDGFRFVVSMHLSHTIDGFECVFDILFTAFTSHSGDGDRSHHIQPYEELVYLGFYFNNEANTTQEF